MSLRTRQSSGDEVLVIGGSGLLGRCCVAEISSAGYEVIATFNDTAPTELGGSITWRHLNLRSVQEVAEFGQAMREGSKPLKRIVLVAATIATGSVRDWDEAEARGLMRVNAFAPVQIVAALWDRLKNARGAIIYVSSSLTSVPFPYLGAYAASKATGAVLFDTLRLESSSGEVGVSIVEPPVMASGLWQKIGQDVRNRGNADVWGDSLLASSQYAQTQVHTATKTAKRITRILGKGGHAASRHIIGLDATIAPYLATPLTRRVGEALVRISGKVAQRSRSRVS